MKRLAAALTLIIAVSVCSSPGQTSAGDGKTEPQNQFPQFSDVTQRAGVHFRTETSPTTQKYLLETMGGGVAIFDYDGDGLMDLFFVNGAQLGDPMSKGEEPDKSHPRYWNRLY